MNNLKNTLLVLMILLFSNTQVFSKDMIGIVAVGIGKISNQLNESLTTGSKLYFGDSIITEAASSAQVLLMDQTTLTIGESSELVIDEFVYDPQTKIGKIISSVKIGTVKIITGEISKTNPDNLEIKTPTGSIGARGTEFAVVTESDTKSTVVLLGPGVNNTLGMVPGNLRVTDGNINIDITQPGFQTVVFK
jgi:hypothetical protein|tara:strand:- start:35 stop:610 length:576 start_codon:yes stop_codon:yes gene_type:complete